MNRMQNPSQQQGAALVVGLVILVVITVLAISGITAYETQAIKNMYYEHEGRDVISRKAIFGAFLLYGSFISMFIHILNLLGIMNND